MSMFRADVLGIEGLLVEGGCHAAIFKEVSMCGMRRVFIGVVMVSLFFSVAFANKSSVEIQAPETARTGSKITIAVRVIHEGNNFLHYTNWVYIKANGKEIARWDFTMGNRPDGEVFTRQIEYTVAGPVEIEAMANCNLHGSTGPRSVTVRIK